MNFYYYRNYFTLNTNSVYFSSEKQIFQILYEALLSYGRIWFQIIFPFYLSIFNKNADSLLNYLGVAISLFFLGISIYKKDKRTIFLNWLLFMVFIFIPMMKIKSFAQEQYAIPLMPIFFMIIIKSLERLNEYKRWLLITWIGIYFFCSMSYLPSFQNATALTDRCIEINPSENCVTTAISMNFSNKNFLKVRQLIEDYSVSGKIDFGNDSIVTEIYLPYSIFFDKNIVI